MKTTDIINGLEAISNHYSYIAVIWHIIFYSLIIAFFLKWEPTNRLLSVLLVFPIISVAILAWINGNPFNGTAFSILAFLFLFFALKTSNQPLNTSQIIYQVVGILLIIYGLVYPHFIETNTIFQYLYASPIGLVPCPTLSVIIGFILLFNGFGLQSIHLVFIIFGLFYGLFGALKLGVYLDLGLIIGSVTLLIKYILSFKFS
jgi:hypothetical protein